MMPLSNALFRGLFAALFLVSFSSTAAHAYSVLSHEEVVDMAWTQQIVPLLKERFPGITDDQIKQAHAYAYAGSIIQDIGYYPFGDKEFSDLLHYARPNAFIAALFRDAQDPNDFAFACGALAHYFGDTLGHPFINEITAQEYPKLRQRFGKNVTYADDPTAHLRVEFGFDVVEGHHRRRLPDRPHRHALSHQQPAALPEVDFDTGKPLGSGEYPLADKTYAKLAERLTTDNDVQLTPQLRADVLAFFDHHTGPNAVEQQPAEWAKVRDALSKLKQTQPAAAPGAGNS